MLSAMLLTAAHVDVTTLTVSAGIAAVVSGFVSWAFNFALGGWTEVRKRRAVRRDDVRAELELAVRAILNAVRLAKGSGWVWHAEGNEVTRFEDNFDQLFAEMEASYRSIRDHLAGRENINPERSIGWAINGAGTLCRRVKDFRDGAIGFPPDGLNKCLGGMRADLGDSQVILEKARDCLSVVGPRRWFRTKRLEAYLGQLEAKQKAGSLPRTPKAYTASLPLDRRVTHQISDSPSAAD
jgi:hypothetical protein